MAEDGGDVTLIIKAANQSVADLRVKCVTTWTVHRLKVHLAHAHPTHPGPEEQRLIYSGQLLSDQAELSTILRRPSENNAYTIHLVCALPTKPTTTMADDTTTTTAATTTTATTTATTTTSGQVHGDTAEGGVRRRAPQPTPPPLDAPGLPPPTPSLTFGSVLPQTAEAMDQLAALQQLYANYVAYVQYVQMGGGMPWPHHAPSIPPTTPAAGSSEAAAAAGEAAAAAAAAGDTQAVDTQPVEAQPVQPGGQQQQQQQQQPVVRMNAQGGEVVEEEEEEEWAARDWLDWIYLLSRMVVLLSIIYFYSTLHRLVFVMMIALALYLYQAGWLRPTRPPPPPPPQEEVADGVEGVAEGVAAGRERRRSNPDPPLTPAASTPPTPPPTPPSLLSLSWTFLSAFITSIIPELPQGV